MSLVTTAEGGPIQTTDSLRDSASKALGASEELSHLRSMAPARYRTSVLAAVQIRDVPHTSCEQAMDRSVDDHRSEIDQVPCTDSVGMAHFASPWARD